MKKSVILLIAALGILSAGAKTVTTSFSVNPGMGCQNCENKIKSNLRFEKGVKKITTSLSDQLVTITFDDEKTSNARLIQASRKQATPQLPPNPETRKPPLHAPAIIRIAMAAITSMVITALQKIPKAKNKFFLRPEAGVSAFRLHVCPHQNQPQQR